MRRRHLLLAGAGLGAAALLALRPGAAGAPHAAYFQRLATALKRAGVNTPSIVVDHAILRQNTAQLLRNLDGKLALRSVVKSLPSLPLLQELMRQSGSDKTMLFSLPQLIALAPHSPDILLGKPMPVAAAAQFYQRAGAPAPGRRVQWLIDTPRRLAQYRELARGAGLTLELNLEIDVGLHRGGLASRQDMAECAQLIRSEPRLRYSGLMGYDAHIAKLPDVGTLQADALAYAQAQYAGCAAFMRERLGAPVAPPTYNTAGSPTYRLYGGGGVQNEVAIGSALLKPGDFDTPLLADLQPACWIATPVLKALPQFQMPRGVEWLGAFARGWDANQRHAYFIYGGNWLADPVSPAGLAASRLYGASSNQQLLLGSGLQGLQADDYVFFRPRQSETVLQQFGPLAVYQSGQIAQFWEPLPASG
ncbi:alanine racemase [Janthinobacterium fluminis]|uniref:Alanine racemase n=1 Tax=Janthinobacterium fluminis TaxID=2987524 RepID=A0ABT5K8M7_9BURK|nr:alanine racemase [Janthinobacterium fluminis]MDC8760798.1 alanine racemase [Janthinobacterium fluminis]